MSGKVKSAICGTAVGLGLVMDVLGVAELLGWADIGIFPDIRVNWPVVMILVGTAITCSSVTWIGYGFWQERPAARFRRMYREVESLRDTVSEGGRGLTGSEMNTHNRITELAIVLEGKHRVPCPRSSRGWLEFLQVLTPLIRIGDLKRARRLWEDLNSGGKAAP